MAKYTRESINKNGGYIERDTVQNGKYKKEFIDINTKKVFRKDEMDIVKDMGWGSEKDFLNAAKKKKRGFVLNSVPTKNKQNKRIEFSLTGHKVRKKDYDFDSINTCGISIIEDRAGNKMYKANNHVQFKDFKTYGGAERWLQRQGSQKATKK